MNLIKSLGLNSRIQVTLGTEAQVMQHHEEILRRAERGDFVQLNWLILLSWLFKKKEGGSNRLF